MSNSLHLMIVLTLPTIITMATSQCEVAIYGRSPCQADTWMPLSAGCWLDDAVC